jgi:hypothetical protein
LAVSKELSKHRMTLDASSGTAIARFAHLFGLSETYDLQHIKDFVGRVVDGWSITQITPRETDDAALAFAVTLGSRLHSKKAVEETFLVGVQNGIETLNYFAKRRRTA